MNITRRRFGGIAAALPFLGAAAPLVSNPDVVIVGAGAAGIAAAQTLMNGGHRVQVVEAAARIGGRCYTDTASLGAAFDAGASWLRNAERNPLNGFAKVFGFETRRHDPAEVLFANGRQSSAEARQAYERAFDALSVALAEAAEEDDDVAANVVPQPEIDAAARDWLPTAAAAIGPFDMGVDFESMSVKDWFNRDDLEPSFIVRQGVGTLVNRIAFNLPVAVNTVVRDISVSGGRVSVATSGGTLNARAAIVSVSPGVLKAESIAFEPGLSAEMTAGLNGLDMGLISKVALSFAPGSAALAFGEDRMLVPQVRGERGHYFLIRPFGAPVVICFTGGSLAWDLATQSEATNVAFAIDRLKAALGNNAAQGLRDGVATKWGTDPLTRGAHAVAKPGERRARRALNEPIGERVFLAGEALAGKAAQTAHGAYETGQRAARRVIELLKKR